MSEEQAIYRRLHPKEAELIDFIRNLKFGVIRELKVHEGLPELADVEVVRRVKFRGEGK